MNAVPRMRSWLRDIFGRSRVEQRMADELRFHIDSYAADLEHAGVAPAEARRRARAEFGGVEARKEECREALGFRLADELVADVRYAYRQLRHSPVFTVVAIASLALGIGANTAVFSLMEAALWKSAAVHEPDRLQLFSWVSGPRVLMNSSSGNWHRTSSGGDARASTSFSYPIFEAFRHDQAVFDTVFAIKSVGRVIVLTGGEPELLEAQLVSGDFYAGVGVAPAAGRTIGPRDDVNGQAETVAVISHGYWMRRFGGDASVVGTRIRVNQTPVTIVGVNAPGFTGIDPGERADVILPLGAQPIVAPGRTPRTTPLIDDPDNWWVQVIGRLKPGVTPAQAQSAMAVAFRQAVLATMPDRPDRDQPHLRLLPGARGQDNLRESFGSQLVALLTLAGIVLLIACANVASLLLARAVVRRREISLRLALGAGRWRIVRQLLTEGLALGAAGGAVGIVLAYWTRNAVPGLLLPSWASGDLELNARFDGRVLALTLLVTFATTILASVAPIWQAVRADIHASLKEGARSTRGPLVALRGRALVVVQVCLSVALLIGSGLFVRTVMNLRSVGLGFNPERVVLFSIDAPRMRYTGAARRVLFDRLDQAIGAIPGVESASVSEAPLLSGGSSRTRVGPDGRQPEPKDDAWVNDVGRHFFDTMEIPILAGRSFDDRDHGTSPPVVVVNRQFANAFFPNQNPVGRSLRNNGIVYEIVGVCGNTPFGKLREAIPPTFYRHFAQPQSREAGAANFQVRTSAGEAALMTSVRAAVAGLDKDLPVFDVRTQMEQIDALLSRERLFMALTTGFALLALVLASIGIYGLLAQGVSRRTNEIGLRLALGAARRDVLVMILREASSLAALGAVIGAIAAAMLSRYVSAMLFGIAPADPAVFAGAVAVTMLVALLAGWIPARKASRLDPMAALRHE
jgi:predicted permease